MDAKIVFFGQKYVLDVILRPLGLIWGPRELKNPIFGQKKSMFGLGIGGFA